MLKLAPPPTLPSRRRPPPAGGPRSGAVRRTAGRQGGDRPAAIELAADAGRARAGANDRRRRNPRRHQAQRGRHRRPARRVARPRARGVPRPGGLRPRAPREQPRRVRPRDRQRRGSRRDLRAARRARGVRRAPRRAHRLGGRVARVARPRHRDGARGRAQRRRGVRRRQRRVPRAAGRTRRERQAARHLPSPRQPAAPPPARHARPGRRAAGVRRASTTTSSRRSPPAVPRLPDARLPTTWPPAASGCAARGHRPPPRHPPESEEHGESRPHARRQRPPLSRTGPSRRRRLHRRLRTRLHQPGDRGRPRALPRCARAARHLPHRRLRGPVVHQSEQPVDRHRRAALRPRHLRQLLLGPRGRRRGDDERPEVPAHRDAARRVRRRGREGGRRHRQGQAARAPRPPAEGHLLLRREGRPGDGRRQRHR